MILMKQDLFILDHFVIMLGDRHILDTGHSFCQTQGPPLLLWQLSWVYMTCKAVRCLEQFHSNFTYAHKYWGCENCPRPHASWPVCCTHQQAFLGLPLGWAQHQAKHSIPFSIGMSCSCVFITPMPAQAFISTLGVMCDTPRT